MAAKRGAPALKTFWRRIRKPLAQSPVAKNLLAWGLVGIIRFVRATNRAAPGSADPARVLPPLEPVIVTLWHGQHLLVPAFIPRKFKVTALFSRSADAELNALVMEKFGFDVVRGSGGRAGHVVDKGGARALIALKRLLDAGRNVTMIADIPHGTPREAGLGIVTLARLTGRPILPGALATSRRKVLEKSWDRTTINLPFGRYAIAFGSPVEVPADADDAMMEMKRREVTASLNMATDEAYRLADGRR